MIESPTVFVFDDEVGIKDNIKEFLIEEGYNVIDAISYKQAAAKIKEEFLKTSVNLAILDIKQTIGTKFLPPGIKPEKVGFALANMIQKIDASIPVIFLTGFEEMQREAGHVQHFRFFTKGAGTPIGNPEVMRKAIVEAFEEHEIRKEVESDKICINDTNGSTSTKYVVNISDILYFTGEGGVTKIRVKGLDKVLSLSMNAVKFKDKLYRKMELRKIPNTFFMASKGKYANLNQVTAFNAKFAFFDYDLQKKNSMVEINTAAAHLLNLRFPYVRTTRGPARP